MSNTDNEDARDQWEMEIRADERRQTLEDLNDMEIFKKVVNDPLKFEEAAWIIVDTPDLMDEIHRIISP